MIFGLIPTKLIIVVISDQGVELKIGEGNLSFLLSSIVFEICLERSHLLHMYLLMTVFCICYSY